MSTSPIRDTPAVPSSIYDKVDKLNNDLNDHASENDDNLTQILEAIQDGFERSINLLSLMLSDLGTQNSRLGEISQSNNLISDQVGGPLLDYTNSLLEDIKNNTA